jgi:hypothetical protein
VSAGTATTDSNGIASLAYDIPMGLGTGAHNVSATYDGSADPAFNGTTREAAVLTVIKAGTGISLYNVQGRLGGSVQLRAVLVSKGAAVAGRTVSFAVGGAAVGSATTDSSGVASVTYAIPLSLGTGAHNVTATFDGTADTTYRDSSVTGAALSVIKAATGVTFYAAQGVQYTHVDLRCVLFGAGVRLPGKTVAFYVDNVYVASGVTNGAGVAGVTHYIGGAAPGLHAVRCVFDGSADPRYASTTRTESVLTVDPL